MTRAHVEILVWDGNAQSLDTYSEDVELLLLGPINLASCTPRSSLGGRVASQITTARNGNEIGQRTEVNENGDSPGQTMSRWKETQEDLYHELLTGYQAIDQSVREIFPSQVRGVLLCRNAGITATERVSLSAVAGDWTRDGREAAGRSAAGQFGTGPRSRNVLTGAVRHASLANITRKVRRASKGARTRSSSTKLPTRPPWTR